MHLFGPLRFPVWIIDAFTMLHSSAALTSIVSNWFWQGITFYGFTLSMFCEIFFFKHSIPFMEVPVVSNSYKNIIMWEEKVCNLEILQFTAFHVLKVLVFLLWNGFDCKVLADVHCCGFICWPQFILYKWLKSPL